MIPVHMRLEDESTGRGSGQGMAEVDEPGAAVDDKPVPREVFIG